MKKTFASCLVMVLFLYSLLMLSACSNHSAGGSNLNLLGEDEKIISISGGDYMVCALTDQGNCYVAGQSATEDYNFGLEDYQAYNDYFDLFHPDRFVQIYDKGDAESISMSYSGGCIITKDHNVYLFLNHSDFDDYATPRLFCSDCVDAQIGWLDDSISLLRSNGDFGYVPIDSPDDFRLIGKNVSKFKFATDKNNNTTLFVLTNNHQLYMFNSEEVLEDQNDFIEDVIDFDVQSSTGCLVLSIINSDHNAYHSALEESWCFNRAKIQSNLKLIGSNVSSVVSYDAGTVMKDSDGKVRIYGSDIKNQFEEAYTGESVFQNKTVKDVCSTYTTLTVLTNDNQLNRFGYTLNDGVVAITPELR